MAVPSKRLERVAEYYFAKKLEEVRQMEAAGKRILRLGIGNPDLPPHPDVVEALRETATLEKVHGYQPYKGLPELQAAMLSRLPAKEPMEVLPLAGSKEGITFVTMAFTNPGDNVLVPDPGYPTYSTVANLLEVEARPFAIHAANDWQPDLEALEQLADDRTRILWLTNPHMPTGSSLKRDVLQSLVKWAKTRKILVVLDAAYMRVLNPEPFSIFELEGALDVAIEMHSLSKSHNMAGWRIGWIAGHPELISKVLQIRSHFDCGMFLPVQRGAIKAFSVEATWHREQNEILAKRQQAVYQLLDLLGCAYPSKSAGLFVWATLPEGEPDCYAFVDKLLDQYGIFVTPGGIFGANGSSFIRVSLCADLSVIETAIKAIQAV